jgi:methionine aminotransferase
MNMNNNTLRPINLPTRLPKVGTTIFTVMSALANDYQAINLGQGFPDFSCDSRLLDAVNEAMRSNHNQYPPMAGIAVLREGISKKISALYNHTYDPLTEITVTAGGTQGIFTAIACAVRPGDEVIVLEPVYDSYIPAIDTVGGTAIPVQLTLQRDGAGDITGYAIPWDEIKQAISSRTRMIMINSPHNPTGMVWQANDLEKLADLIRGTDILVCSDEVYEHMVYDGQQHQSVARHPELANRSFLISSFGKTYHVTGWKVGYVAAPEYLMQEFRKVHQFNVFTVNTPMQYGLANYLQDATPYLQLARFYQQKRDFLRSGLQTTRFKLLPTPGTYFQCVNYTHLDIPESSLNESDFCQWLTKEIGVAAIPVSAFYDKNVESGVIRFCFAKQETTLQQALERLSKL